MPHTTNYFSTLIRPAPDCKAASASVPQKPGSVAAAQFEMMRDAAYRHSSDDIIATVQAARKNVPEEDVTAFRVAYFSKGQPCLRCSPLVKTHGWAIHHDAEGRVAVLDPASDAFARLDKDPEVTKIDGMRNARK